MGFGNTHSGGRKRMYDEAKLIKNLETYSVLFWDTLGKWFRSDDEKKQQFAMTEFNKIQVRTIPQDITSGGEKLNFYDERQLKTIAARTISDGESKSERPLD